jgi:hypothetical protein
MAVRLIAIDIDGTLLDSRWQVPEQNRAVITEAVARGLHVVLVTGRRFDFARPIAAELPREVALICNNGAVIKTSDGTTHLRHLLPREIARAVLDATPQFREGAAVVFDRPRENQVIWEVLDYSDPGRRGYFERNREFIAQCSPLENCLTEDPIQVMFSGTVAPIRECERVLRTLPFAGQYALAVTFYESRDFGLVDVIHPACSKGHALAEWARHNAIAREEVMAIGDNLNDREMLEFAGVPVVMGNGVSELKDLGWRVTLSNDQNGVAVAIQQYAFEGT